MRIKLVEEIHDSVSLQRCAADNHVFLALRSVRRVRATQLLPLHPRESQLLQLFVK